MRGLRMMGLLAVLGLSACAGGMTFDQHLRQLEGKPVNDADLMLGRHSTGQYQDGNATVYVWQARDAESIFGRSVSSGRGYGLGSPMDDGHELLLSGVQLHSCVIRARTMDNIIQRVTYEGNPGGCETIYGYKRKPLGVNSSD